MDIGIGLPNAVPGVDRDSLLDLARRADQRGFSSLGSIGRLVYPNFDCLISLAAAAAVTERIRLMPAILIAPLHANTALLAKQVATIDALSGGRLVLGVGLGARQDDYDASGLDFKTRGARLDEQLDEMKRIWAGEERGFAGAIGPPPAQPGGPPVLVGGGGNASFERVAKYGAGWLMAALPPDQFAANAPKVDEAWERAGREGRPRKASITYFALGANAQADAEHNLKHYYAWLGDEVAGMIAGGAATSEDAVRSVAQAFEDAGCDELVFVPASKNPEQADLLAEALGLGR
jgi:alkanesulfonate monooxygenase SsuD/methylene tetrahydromethanopterin reductase-like flavin-dependent oxidoreductase (luciferase family)